MQESCVSSTNILVKFEWRRISTNISQNGYAIITTTLRKWKDLFLLLQIKNQE